jgi:hypothetical protein
MNIIAELYQFLFISSIVFMIYIFSDLIMKTIGRFKLKNKTQFILTKLDKVIKKGFEKLYLQKSPHLALISRNFYDDEMKEYED